MNKIKSKHYVGFKEIKARPMNSSEAVTAGYRTGDAGPGAAGYEVEYPDGYKSWSPAAAFDEAYSQVSLSAQLKKHPTLSHLLGALERPKGSSKADQIGRVFVAVAQRILANCDPESEQLTLKAGAAIYALGAAQKCAMAAASDDSDDRTSKALA